ncbi:MULTISPECIES: DUF3560 domain-containing protein [Streptomyces]|uniref:DUF3560 domain-containing protein n=1 Tax=Streptomyces sp. 900129855 TaxID=3155129 RepID=A0ABV2ZRS2_9ACTN
MADITITHTRADGTLVDGPTGDGVYELMNPYGFRFSQSLGCMYLRGSRDGRADRWNIDSAAKALRAAGHTVTIDIDETRRRSFAWAEAERYERAGDRAVRFGAKADAAQASSDAKWERGRQITRGYAGEPVKIDHYSAKRHMRDLERAQRLCGQAVEEQQAADHYARRAVAAAHFEEHRRNPQVTLRRLERLNADRRVIERQQEATVRAAVQAGESSAAIAPETLADNLARLDADHFDLCDEIGYWETLIEQAKAEGVKVWGPADFKKNDYALVCGRWLQVVRVNAKSLAVPGGPDERRIISIATRRCSWDARVPYTNVVGRKSPEEMAEMLAEKAGE